MAAMVAHGRRKGQLKPAGGQDRSTGAMRQSQAHPPARSLVIPAAEWSRIQETLSGTNRQEQTLRATQNERETLRNKSKAMVKNWANTIEGQRLKKLEARKIREEKEEAERVKIDIAEAKFQADERRKAIEKAKTLLYHQTDRVKKFHGALLLSEVLREREAQIEVKAAKVKRSKEVDKRYQVLEEEERRKGILQDMEAAEKRARAQAEVSMFQIKQVMERRKEDGESREAALKEQKKIEEEVGEFHKQQNVQDGKRKEHKKDYRAALDGALTEKQAYLAEKKRMEELEDEEIQLYATAKKKMTRLRKDKESEIFREFQEHQNRMTKSLEQHMTKQKSDEDERIAIALAETEAKRKAEEMAKAQKAMETMHDIHQHRVQMINDLEMKRKEATEMDKRFLQQRIVQDQKFHAQQLDKMHKAKMEASRLQGFHRQQMEERDEVGQADREEEDEYYRQNLDLLHLEEGQFQEYAGNVIQKAKQRGANVQPLVKAATKGGGGGHGPIFDGKGGVRPSFLAMDSTGVQLPSYQSKHKPQVVLNTQKRIGFTW